jgi:hypothetical protein
MAKTEYKSDNSSSIPLKSPILTRWHHVIHFEDLSPTDFERICLWLIKAEGYTDCEHVGLLGKDNGCDLKAWKQTRRRR